MRDAPNGPQDDTANRARLRVWLRMLKVSRGIETQLRENFRAAFGTTLPRFDVLAALSRFEDGLKMSEISSALKVSNGNVTGLVDRLADEGLLIRVAVPGDRRAARVQLTQRGRAEFARQAEAHAGWINQMMAELDRAEADALSDMLDQLDQDSAARAPKETAHAE